MLYTIAHFIKDKLPFIWDFIDGLNSFLFSLRYGRKLKVVERTVLPQYAQSSGLKIVRMKEVSADELASFFDLQPDEAYTFFKPHGFDHKSLRKLQRNRSFLAYILLEDNKIAAYCFIRSFFMGKGFRGRMVGIGLKLFETVSKDNVASYRSALSASKVKVVKELDHNELYLEILREE